MSADRGSPPGSNLQLLGLRSSRQRPVGIQHLPIEILHEILVFSRSSALPITCRHFRQACQNAGSLVKAEFVLERWSDHLIDFIKAHPCRAKHKACRGLASRLAGRERNHDLSRFEITDCFVSLIQIHHLDIITFAAEFGVATATVMKRITEIASASLSGSLAACVLPPLTGMAESVPMKTASGARGSSLLAPQIPKRLFRRIDQPISGGQVPNAAIETAPSTSGEPRPKKRRRRRKDIATGSETDPHEAADESAARQAWLSKLLLSLAREPQRSSADSGDAGKRKREEVATASMEKEIQSRVGPVPGADDMEMILALLLQYAADASSHQGYPLAMAVHRRAYSLAHLLLLFGADPNCKEGLAAQIAIRNGSRDILHLLVTGPCLDVDAIESLPIPATRLDQLGSRTFKLDQTHLRLAIQCKQWQLVDYIWHEQHVSPDIACLRLIDKLRH